MNENPVLIERSGTSTKFIEVRDAGTFIPTTAVRINVLEGPMGYLMRRAGYEVGRKLVLLLHIESGVAYVDRMNWKGGRTMFLAHGHIEEHWDEISSNDVVDVGYLLGLSETPKISERFTVETADFEVVEEVRKC